MSFNFEGNQVVENKPIYTNEYGTHKLTYDFRTDPRLKRGHNFGIIYVTTPNYEDNVTGASSKNKKTKQLQNGAQLLRGRMPMNKTDEKRAKAEHEGFGICTDKVITTVRPKPITFEEIIQTDELPPRPQSPLIWPKKTGIDVNTQIEDGDLFCFDEEVKPIVHILVSKTLEESRREVLEEEELHEIFCQQKKYAEFNKEDEQRVRELEAEEKERFQKHLEKKDKKRKRIEFSYIIS